MQTKFKALNLARRSQTTLIGPYISQRLDSTCRVPQGSVSRPTAFLLYINYIPESSDKLSFCLIADDTNILFADKIVGTLLICPLPNNINSSCTCT